MARTTTEHYAVLVSAPKREIVWKKCQHCNRGIYFQSGVNKWVTSKDRWKCGNDSHFPVRAHCPEESIDVVKD